MKVELPTVSTPDKLPLGGIAPANKWLSLRDLHADELFDLIAGEMLHSRLNPPLSKAAKKILLKFKREGYRNYLPESRTLVMNLPEEIYFHEVYLDRFSRRLDDAVRELGYGKYFKRFNYRPQRSGKERPNESSKKESVSNSDGLVTSTLEKMKATATKWMWRDRIPFGSVTVLAGEAGIGKSTIALSIAAELSKKNQQTLLIADEDDYSSTVVPRLTAAGANRSMIHKLDDVSVNGDKTDPQHFEILRDIAHIESFLLQHPDVNLIVVDPWLNYCGDKNSYSAQEVRQILMPLQNLARKHQIVILAIAHFRKASADGANDRVGGSGALIQVARSVLLVAKTEDKPDSTSGELHQTKHNLNSRKKGKKYSIVSVKLTDAITTSRIEWGGDSDKDFDTLIAPKDPADRQIDRCAEWLRSFLEEAECLATEVVTHANRHGFTQSTLYRAKSLIHIHTRKDDNGCSHWSLPDHALETR